MQLVQVLDLALEVLALRALRGGADDHAALAHVDLLRGPPQAVALLVLEPARDARALSLRHVHEVAARDRELHREARPLGLERILDRLDQDLLAGLQELGDALALAASAASAAAAAPCDLHAREDHVVRVQEAVLVEADVNEGGLEAGQDVVDLALVDVSDDRAVALALYVELGNAPVVGLLVLLTAASSSLGGAPGGCPPIPGSRLWFRLGPPRRATASSRRIPFIKVIGASPRPCRALARESIAVRLLP